MLKRQILTRKVPEISIEPVLNRRLRKLEGESEETSCEKGLGLSEAESEEKINFRFFV